MTEKWQNKFHSFPAARHAIYSSYSYGYQLINTPESADFEMLKKQQEQKNNQKQSLTVI